MLRVILPEWFWDEVQEEDVCKTRIIVVGASHDLEKERPPCLPSLCPPKRWNGEYKYNFFNEKEA